MAYGEQRPDRKGHQDGVYGVAERRAAESIERTAQRRPEHRRQLPAAGAPGDGIPEQRAWHQLGAERLAGRLQEGACQTTQHDDGVDRTNARGRRNREVADRCRMRQPPEEE